MTVISTCRVQHHIMINRKPLQDPAAFVIIVCDAVCLVHLIKTLHSCNTAFFKYWIFPTLLFSVDDGLPHCTCQWIKGFLSDRTQRVVVGSDLSASAQAPYRAVCGASCSTPSTLFSNPKVNMGPASVFFFLLFFVRHFCFTASLV